MGRLKPQSTINMWLNAAQSANKIELDELAVDFDIPYSLECLATALHFENLEAASWFFTRDIPSLQEQEQLLIDVAAEGKIHSIQFLLAQQDKITPKLLGQVMSSAITGNHISALPSVLAYIQTLPQSAQQYSLNYGLKAACELGHQEGICTLLSAGAQTSCIEPVLVEQIINLKQTNTGLILHTLMTAGVDLTAQHCAIHAAALLSNTMDIANVLYESYNRTEKGQAFIKTILNDPENNCQLYKDFRIINQSVELAELLANQVDVGLSASTTVEQNIVTKKGF